MANETIITVVGNLTADPELRFTPSGHAVSNFNIASTPRFFDRQANEFKDGETLFVRCTAWRELAENIAGSLTKGAAVIAQGQLKAQTFQDREGQDRTSWQLSVDTVGASLARATVQITRTGQSQQPGSQQRPAPSRQSGTGWGGTPPASDPWGLPAQPGEPPFQER